MVSHTRVIDGPVDPKKKPIVERMTRERLANLTPEAEEMWKRKSIETILAVALTPRPPVLPRPCACRCLPVRSGARSVQNAPEREAFARAQIAPRAPSRAEA